MTDILQLKHTDTLKAQQERLQIAIEVYTEEYSVFPLRLHKRLLEVNHALIAGGD